MDISICITLLEILFHMSGTNFHESVTATAKKYSLLSFPLTCNKNNIRVHFKCLQVVGSKFITKSVTVVIACHSPQLSCDCYTLIFFGVTQSVAMHASRSSRISTTVWVGAALVVSTCSGESSDPESASVRGTLMESCLRHNLLHNLVLLSC